MRGVNRIAGWDLARTAAATFLASATLGVAGCSEPSAPGACFGSVELSIVEGNAPEFNWDPPCALNTLVVFDAGHQAMWNVYSGVGSNALFPPLRYGVVPPGATQEGDLGVLEPGFAYLVRVFRIDDQGDQLRAVRAGEATFRR